MELSKVSFEAGESSANLVPPAKSNFASSDALAHIQLIQLNDGEGTILYYPNKQGSVFGNSLEVGDVLFLREKEVSNDGRAVSENGIVAQIISLGTANYPHSQTKALFRVMVDVRAASLNRTHNEPPETIDELLEATFKIRASIVEGNWAPPEGRVVTRNVDIFLLDPKMLAKHIFDKVHHSKFNEEEFDSLLQEANGAEEIIKSNSKEALVAENDKCYFISHDLIDQIPSIKDSLVAKSLNIHLGHYKGEPVEFFGGGLEKINLITGMKGGGKSHIAKGIISESIKGGMTAVVFDINNEYQGISPRVPSFIPGSNLKFRLDRINAATLLQFIDRIAPFAERTRFIANSRLPQLLRRERMPDIAFLRSQTDNIFPNPGGQVSEPIKNMRASYNISLDILESTNLIMTRDEIQQEQQFISGATEDAPSVLSLSSALYDIEHSLDAGVIIFNIGGLLRNVQFSVVDMVVDTLKEICSRQTEQVKQNRRRVPNYPTIFFEEAHMYMEPRVIDELLPLIRHFGMNVFFITNTPVALPDSVFRLIDNLIMTRILNKRDIDQVKNCGLTDSDTIEGFASGLKEHHALLLSGLNGTTRNFPLVFKVRNFGLPQSGETRSMWNAIRNTITE